MGNYEIQAKIDIERHPEWNEEEQNTHLYRMKIKDKMLGSTYRERRNELFELVGEYIDKTLSLSWQSNNFFIDYVDINAPSFKEKPWSRGLRASSHIIDEGVC